MAHAARVIDSLLIPLGRTNLLLPQAAVAEVVAPQPVRRLEQAAPWLVGVFEWRREQVPLISLELMCSAAQGQEQRPSRYIVLYGVEGYPGLAFYAVESYGLPRSMKLVPESLLKREGGDFDCDIVAEHVLADDQGAFIPDTGVIERAIRAQLQRL